MQYRKKTATIKAIKLDWNTWNDVCEFIDDEYFGGGVYLDDTTLDLLPPEKTSNTIGLIITTLKGNFLAKQGDYIIKNTNGEFYVCKPDVFESTYESIESEE